MLGHILQVENCNRSFCIIYQIRASSKTKVVFPIISGCNLGQCALKPNRTWTSTPGYCCGRCGPPSCPEQFRNVTFYSVKKKKEEEGKTQDEEEKTGVKAEFRILSMK